MNHSDGVRRKPGLEGEPAGRRAGAPGRLPLDRFGPGIAVVLLIGLFLIFRFEPHMTPSDPGPPPEAVGIEGIQVYFTESRAGAGASELAGPETALVSAIDQAQRSVDVAVYALNLPSVGDALRRADQRGVRVRLVVESDNAGDPEVEALVGAGLPVCQDGRPGLMHHKFVVIDGAEVWTGSMNLTFGATRHDDNNLVRLSAPGLAQDFTAEFDEMFEQDRFGALSLEDTPLARVTIADASVEVLFSPDDGAAERILGLLDDAETTLEFAAFSMTSDSIADRMLAAAMRGVRVRGVMETTQAGSAGSEYENLSAGGLDVRLDGNPFNMHHKFMIIDRAIVVTGSYNFTASAEEQNDENLLVIHDREIARIFGEEFTRIFALAGPSS